LHWVAPAAHCAQPPLKHAGVGLEHPVHAAPAEPHALGDCEERPTHVPLAPEPPEQQPPEHVWSLHAQMPLVLSQSPFVHGEHVAPAWPQDEGPCCE
jgi:hypothetical protein